jgi:ferredoxin
MRGPGHTLTGGPNTAPTLRLEPDGPSVPFPPGERALDALDDAWPGAGLPTACRAGNCGACLVAVVAGSAQLEPPDPHERQTLRALAAPPDQRLGCQVRASPARSGEVVLRVIRR